MFVLITTYCFIIGFRNLRGIFGFIMQRAGRWINRGWIIGMLSLRCLLDISVLKSDKLHVWNSAHMLRPEIILGDNNVLHIVFKAMRELNHGEGSAGVSFRERKEVKIESWEQF